jgi:hypothetical protein
VSSYFNSIKLALPFVLYRNNVLQITKGMDEIGEVRWPLAFTLAIVWTACYFAIFKGVKWTGKVSNGMELFVVSMSTNPPTKRSFTSLRYFPTSVSSYCSFEALP